MLESYYVRPDTADRIRSSWLAPAIEKYVEWLSEHRYANRSVLRRVPVVVRFGEFAKARNVTKLKGLPDQIEPFVESWVRARAPKGATLSEKKKIRDYVRNPIQQMLRLSIRGYVGRRRAKMPANPFEKRAPNFFVYLKEERGLREKTLDKYRFDLRQFAAYLKKVGLKDVKQITPHLVSGFAVDYRRRVTWSGLRNSCSAIKVFLRYLHRERVIARDVSHVVEFPQTYRLSTVPRSISLKQVQAVLECVDRRSPAGKRDYAILLLLATYGLRAREVAALTIDDFDWRNERFRVPERKANHSTGYPLSRLVGEAILDYLKNGRPKNVTERKIFFRSNAPIVPIGSAAVTARCAIYINKAGIKVPRAGSHTLRHSCVQRLVDADFPLKSIGDYVGHRSPSSTQIYGKVAIEALRRVALGDGEDAL